MSDILQQVHTSQPVAPAASQARPLDLTRWHALLRAKRDLDEIRTANSNRLFQEVERLHRAQADRASLARSDAFHQGTRWEVAEAARQSLEQADRAIAALQSEVDHINQRSTELAAEGSRLFHAIRETRAWAVAAHVPLPDGGDDQGPQRMRVVSEAAWEPARLVDDAFVQLSGDAPPSPMPTPAAQASGPVPQRSGFGQILNAILPMVGGGR